ncbi:serine/threonine-protein kinase Sgk1-like isoform X2 [Halichondria panicea]|uniref:serine/threonine-protein kinase Sgk1-like isoform X2 n=1 Tax=Halichondria panicea TaxID=6063 RepID=UPI00312B3444
MSDYLTIEDLKKVYLVTFDARVKWRNILLVLDVSPATINNVGTKWRDNPDDCYREGLSEWLTGGERSWEDVMAALSSPIVGHSDIASTIEREHVQSTGASNPTDVKSEVNQNRQKINGDLIIFLDEPLGKGAFGAVFKSSYKGEICAVKVLLHDAMEMQASIAVSKSEDATDAIDRESDFLKSIQHPNIVQFLSTAKHPKSGGTILVVELMDCNLRSYFSGLDEESLTSECEISLSKDMACGLAYIHSKQIIHRDLCGDNILLKLTLPVPVAKISDFGMSRLYDPSKLSSTLTAIGQRRGYLPPEAYRLEEENYDNSLDVFSFGVIVAQIVCKLETIKSAKDRSFHVAQIPHTHRLRKLIDNCLQEDMTRRPSARDIYDSLTGSSDPVETTKRESKDTQPVEKGPPPLTLKWRRGIDMPIKMSRSVQSVVIGDTVYVGGGWTDIDRDRCTVMQLEQDQWTILPEYTARCFAMTSLANRLVLVGGHDPRYNQPTNQLAVFNSGRWTHPYPPMSIARYCSTAVSFNNNIIVAGGWIVAGRISSVEVLDVASRRWKHPLPNGRVGSYWSNQDSVPRRPQ